jgi:hypothetical protein
VLTDATIELCPPARPPSPLDRLLEVSGVRSIDLHRYRARLNLVPDADADAIAGRIHAILADAWGVPFARRAEPVRAFPVRYAGVRLVAESLAMAGSQPFLRALFQVDGVSEAILEPGLVRIRLGALFAWVDVEEDVARGLDDLREAADDVR